VLRVSSPTTLLPHCLHTLFTSLLPHSVLLPFSHRASAGSFSPFSFLSRNSAGPIFRSSPFFFYRNGLWNPFRKMLKRNTHSVLNFFFTETDCEIRFAKSWNGIQNSFPFFFHYNGFWNPSRRRLKQNLESVLVFFFAFSPKRRRYWVWERLRVGEPSAAHEISKPGLPQ